MLQSIERAHNTGSVVIAAGASASGVIDMRGYSGAAVLMPATLSNADIAIYGCETSSGTFAPLVDKAGALIKLTGDASGVERSSWYALPEEVFSMHYIKLVSITVSAETAANQAEERTFKYVLKG